jgi:hypothetical protein
VNGDEDALVTGTMYGSALGLLLALAVPLLCISVPLTVAGVSSWAAPVAIVLVGLVVAPWMRRNSTLSINGEGVTLLRVGRLAFVPWSNVASVSEGWFPSLVFEQPQKLAWRHARRLRFDAFDLHWRTRQSTTAILESFARSRTTDP